MLPGMPRDTTLPARQRFEFRIARILAALPPRLQVRLSGRPPVVVDGQRLDPGAHPTRPALERRGTPPLESLSPPETREVTVRQRAVAGGPALPVGQVRD